MEAAASGREPTKPPDRRCAARSSIRCSWWSWLARSRRSWGSPARSRPSA